MILNQFYLNCPRTRVSRGRRDDAHGCRVVRSATSINTLLCREHGLDPARVSDAFPRRFVAGHLELRDRPAPPLPRCGGQGQYRCYTIARRRRRRARARPAESARDAGSHGGVDLHPRVRPRPQRVGSARRAHRDTLFIGDVGRPDLRAALDGPRPSSAVALTVLRTKLLPLPDDSLVFRRTGRGPVWQGPQPGTVSTSRGTASIELRAAADARNKFVDLGQPISPEPPRTSLCAVLTPRAPDAR